VLLALGCLRDRHNNLRSMERCEKEKAEFLLKERQAPRYAVEITTKDGKFYATEPFEPIAQVDYLLDWYVHTETSKEQAEELIDDIFDDGCYWDEDGEETVVVPECNIKDLKITKVRA
jgi:hypothetical protein